MSCFNLKIGVAKYIGFKNGDVPIWLAKLEACQFTSKKKKKKNLCGTGYLVNNRFYKKIIFANKKKIEEKP